MKNVTEAEKNGQMENVIHNVEIRTGRPNYAAAIYIYIWIIIWKKKVVVN